MRADTTVTTILLLADWAYQPSRAQLDAAARAITQAYQRLFGALR